MREGDSNRDARETETDTKRSSDRKRAKTFTKDAALFVVMQNYHHSFSLQNTFRLHPLSPKFLIGSFKKNLSFLQLCLFFASQITFASLTAPSTPVSLVLSDNTESLGLCRGRSLQTLLSLRGQHCTWKQKCTIKQTTEDFSQGGHLKQM